MQHRSTTPSDDDLRLPESAEQIRKKLLDERRGVISTITGITLNDANPEENSQPADYPSVDHLRDLEYKHREALSFRLRLLDNALEKIGSGAYGICEICGTRIVDKRLANDPAVRFCIRCQSSVEGPTVNTTL